MGLRHPVPLLSWLWLRHLSPRRRRPFCRGFFFVLRTAAVALAGKVDLYARRDRGITATLFLADFIDHHDGDAAFSV